MVASLGPLSMPHPGMGPLFSVPFRRATRLVVRSGLRGPSSEA